MHIIETRRSRLGIHGGHVPTGANPKYYHARFHGRTVKITKDGKTTEVDARTLPKFRKYGLITSKNGHDYEETTWSLHKAQEHAKHGSVFVRTDEGRLLEIVNPTRGLRRRYDCERQNGLKFTHW